MMLTKNIRSSVADFINPKRIVTLRPKDTTTYDRSEQYQEKYAGTGGYDSSPYHIPMEHKSAARKEMGAKLNQHGNLCPAMMDRADPIMPFKAAPGEVQRVNTKVGAPLLSAMRAFYDAHAEEFLAFEDARAGLAISDPNAAAINARGHQHVRGHSRVGFMRSMREKYAHEEYGLQVYYDENHGGNVAPLLPKDSTDEERASYVSESSKRKAAANKAIVNHNTVYRHDPNLEPKWKVGAFNILTMMLQYTYWRSRHITPVAIVESITNNFDRDPEAAETFGRAVLDGLTNGDLLAEVAASYGISYADMQRFLRLCRKNFPTFERDYYQALDDGLEQYLHEILQDLNNSIGYVRDGKQMNIAAFNAERQALGELASTRKWMVASAKASRYYMGPSKASTEGAAQAAPTIHLNFGAPQAVPINVQYTVDNG